ncbi:hypothetical protein EV426DRAFT_605361 [Tirmania nivea]|nr:hypothetical protein EV426DRAFT_605361 [Tirmania nivea]
MSSFTCNSHPSQYTITVTQEDFTASPSSESTMFDIFNGIEEAPPLVNCDTTNSSRRASTSSCSYNDVDPDTTANPVQMFGVDYISPCVQSKPERRISTRHVVESSYDSATYQHVREYGMEIREYENYFPGDDTQKMETMLVDLSAAAEVSKAIMTGTNLNLKLVAAGAKESFRYRVNKVEVKTWTRHAAFIHGNELQCYIRPKE